MLSNGQPLLLADSQAISRAERARRWSSCRQTRVTAMSAHEDAMNIDFPFHFDTRGRTAASDDAEHVRDMLEQLLFTNPGERVNRPEFGSGLLQLVFAPNSPELAAALQFTMRAAIQHWLGDVVDVQALEVTAEDATLRIRSDTPCGAPARPRTETFERSVP